MWIDTIIDMERMYSYFGDCKEVEPSDIILLSKDETIDGIAAFVFLSNGNVEDNSKEKW